MGDCVYAFGIFWLAMLGMAVSFSLIAVACTEIDDMLWRRKQRRLSTLRPGEFGNG